MTKTSPSGPRQLGPYRLLGVIGIGSMGTVYYRRGAARRGGRKGVAAVRALRPDVVPSARALRGRWLF